MRALRSLPTRAWRELTRPRAVAGRQPRHGVALLLVMVALDTMSAVVTDFSYNQEVKLRLAIRDRDILRAQYLARGGAEVGRILLSFQEQIQPLLDFAVDTLKLPLPGFTIWQLIPLDSDLLRAFASGQIQEMLGFDIDRDEIKDKVRKVIREQRTGEDGAPGTPEEGEEKEPGGVEVVADVDVAHASSDRGPKGGRPELVERSHAVEHHVGAPEQTDQRVGVGHIDGGSAQLRTSQRGHDLSDGIGPEVRDDHLVDGVDERQRLHRHPAHTSGTAQHNDRSHANLPLGR